MTIFIRSFIQKTFIGHLQCIGTAGSQVRIRMAEMHTTIACNISLADAHIK